MINRLNKRLLILLFLAIFIVQVVGAADPLVANFIITPNSGRVPFTVTITDTSTGSEEWIMFFVRNPAGVGSQIPPGVTYPPKVFTYEISRDVNCWNNDNDKILIRQLAHHSDGTESYLDKYIAVERRPDIVSSFTTAPSSGPAPLNVQFTDISSKDPTNPIIKWYWDFGDGSFASVQNPIHTYTISGVYNAKLNAYGYATCKPTIATTTITVLSPLNPGATISSNPTQTTTTTTTSVTNSAVTTVQKTVLTTATTAPIVTTYSTLNPTRSPIPKATIKNPTPWPTNTPTQPSSLGIEMGIIATIGAAFLIMKQK
jgi:PKD repeat protein